MGTSRRLELARPALALRRLIDTTPIRRSGSSPLAIVLSGGGARAAYQTGVLSYVCRRVPSLSVPIVTGVSAGAINAAFLAAQGGPLDTAVEALKRRWCSLTTEQVFRADPVSLTGIGARWLYRLFSGGARLGPEVRGLVDNRPLREFLLGTIDFPAIETNIQEGRLRAAAITATSYSTGQTVTFVQGEPGISTWERGNRVAVHASLTVDHVMASAALPVLFPATRLGSEYFGDGSLRQRTPLAPAVHLGAGRLFAISTRYPRTAEEAAGSEPEGYPPPARVAGLLFNSIFLDALDEDAARLDRINELLGRIPEGPSRPQDLRPVELLVLRPSQDLGRLAAEYAEHLPGFLRFLVSGIGARHSESSDLLSYLLFESAYISRLIELGEKDGERNWPRVEAFLAP
ncbi:MAG: patatin-like phospholipase family protein [Gemmatimonadota bacterium]